MVCNREHHAVTPRYTDSGWEAKQEMMLEKFLNIQHRCNPMHLHCRLVEKGVNKGVSISICRYYEILIYSWLAWVSSIGVQVCKLLKSP